MQCVIAFIPTACETLIAENAKPSSVPWQRYIVAVVVASFDQIRNKSRVKMKTRYDVLSAAAAAECCKLNWEKTVSAKQQSTAIYISLKS